MSLQTVTMGFLTLKPTITVEGDVIRARTGFLLQLLTLFAFRRLVLIDRARRKVGIERRILWVLGGKTIIPFDDVEHIDLSFGSLSTSWGSVWTGYEPTDQVEKFTVSLVLTRPPGKVKLFSFVGEGSRQTGLAGVLLGGDSLIDYAGDQDGASREFAVLLRDFIGVPVGKPLPHIPDTTGRRFVCDSCGRPCGPGRPTCLYCGGTPVVLTDG